MTIHLPEDLESSILEAVHSGQFASIDDAMAEAARLLLRQLEQQPAPQLPTASEGKNLQQYKPIWELADELRKSIPPEEWDKLPVDGAAQHDHYIYGTPKRPAS